MLSSPRPSSCMCLYTIPLKNSDDIFHHWWKRLRCILHAQHSDGLFLYFSFQSNTCSTDVTFELGKGGSSKNWKVCQGCKLHVCGLESACRHAFVFHTWWCPTHPNPLDIWLPLDRLNCLLGHRPYCSLLPCSQGFLCFPYLASS